MNTSESVPPSSILLARGILALLSTWPALRISVSESWGGPQSSQKRTWLAGIIVDAFTENPNSETPDADYIEEMLLQIMEDEFDCVLEDGSAEATAKGVVRLWDAISNKGVDEVKPEVERLEEVARRVEGKKVEVVQGPSEGGEEEGWEDSDGEDGSEESEDDDKAPRLLPPKDEKVGDGPVIDEDGFTLVKTKGKGRGSGSRS